VERAASADLRALRAEQLIPPGCAALEAAYRLMAREVDRAEREHDRYGKINTVRELVRVRQVLAGTDAVADAATLDELHADLAAKLSSSLGVNVA
jgi:uncharacterized membrane protein YcjF (UPF0283 family)